MRHCDNVSLHTSPFTTTSCAQLSPIIWRAGSMLLVGFSFLQCVYTVLHFDRTDMLLFFIACWALNAIKNAGGLMCLNASCVDTDGRLLLLSLSGLRKHIATSCIKNSKRNCWLSGKCVCTLWQICFLWSERTHIFMLKKDSKSILLLSQSINDLVAMFPIHRLYKVVLTVGYFISFV